ncbi:hypothetical protein ACFUMJ_21925 [Streptomyces olivaceus]|uniref:hypothetical protein n=1 Tax=Streptomyces TaxID=1883 RepID=UPI001CCA88FB|nr:MULTISPECIES: hypothetical protein [Streptomyces]MBZ6134807.1 hypothetical protein [Streptomyces olivaceus]MBZ6253231.1 hypothetical protein [Streptomyces olivaceus]UOG81952.1 hypothetical protein L6J92_23365 [Streptomyces sp. CB09030]
MRRHTGAAGIAVAIAALVPLTDTAHAEGLEARSPVHQEAARPALDADPGGPEPLSPDALPQDSADGGLLDAGGADQGGYAEDPSGPEGAGQDWSGQEGVEQDGFDAGRVDEGRPDGGRLDGSDPGGSHLGGNGIAGNGPGQARQEGSRPEQGGNGGSREAYEGVQAAAAQHWASDPTISATSKPRPTPTAPAPAATTPAPATSAPVASPSAAPTLGTQGGLGGASSNGPSGQDIAIGLGCVASAALATGYALLRRRRNA